MSIPGHGQPSDSEVKKQRQTQKVINLDKFVKGYLLSVTSVISADYLEMSIKNTSHPTTELHNRPTGVEPSGLTITMRDMFLLRKQH